MCECEVPIYYLDDLCAVHREAYERYCEETPQWDRMPAGTWIRTMRVGD